MEKNQIYFFKENLLVRDKKFVFVRFVESFVEIWEALWRTVPPYTAPGDSNGPLKLGAMQGAKDGHPKNKSDNSDVKGG